MQHRSRRPIYEVLGSFGFIDDSAMRVAKRFKWEAAHRLPWHDGPCANLHGHSYRMTVELEGTPDERGMLIDFQHIKRVLKPLIASWDHAVLIGAGDDALADAMAQLGTCTFTFPTDTTTENICAYVVHYLGTRALQTLQAHNVETIRVRLAETETCYAEMEQTVAHFAAQDPDGMKIRTSA